MTISKDDPRLTAYALDAMSADERSAFEQELEGDTTAQAEVDVIRAVGHALERDLATAQAPLLDHRRRKALSKTVAAPKSRSLAAIANWTMIGTAAALLIWFGGMFLFGRGGGGVGYRGESAATEDAAARFMDHAERLSAVVGFNEVPAKSLEPPGGVSSRPLDTEGYDRIRDNPFVHVQDQDVSTFSVDVDTASYANVRRFLDAQGTLPPKGAVRIEELVNYFSYGYAPPEPDAEHPFAVHPSVASCPWDPSHRLVRIALKGKVIEPEQRPAANLVFLLDVSGSMDQPNKLPLLKQSMRLLVDRMEPEDRVAMAVYAGTAGLVLPSTSGEDKSKIVGALDRLQAGGSTNGGAGIELAYRVASENMIPGGVNRVILCTDGDFNVGVSDRSSLTRMIEEKARSGVFLTVLGFGMGNLKDDRLEELSNTGNGNYAYVDTLREARKVLVEEGAGTLVTIARDVKIQVYFNPMYVAGWRLIGYENRLLRKEDFNDDTKDAGEIGAGHAVTALYEIVPGGGEVPGPRGDPNPFVEPMRGPSASRSAAIVQIRVKYKPPVGDKSNEIIRDLFDPDVRFEDATQDFQWASAVAGYGMMLRDSPHKGQCTWSLVEEIASAARGEDREGYRAEFLQLVRLATDLSDR